jgi:hypothetical protein
MAINDRIIQGAITDFDSRKIMSKVNAGTASALDVQASQVSLPLKVALRSIMASTATRPNIEAAALDLPTKAVLLQMAGV